MLEVIATWVGASSRCTAADTLLRTRQRCFCNLLPSPSRHDATVNQPHPVSARPPALQSAPDGYHRRLRLKLSNLTILGIARSHPHRTSIIKVVEGRDPVGHAKLLHDDKHVVCLYIRGIAGLGRNGD